MEVTLGGILRSSSLGFLRQDLPLRPGLPDFPQLAGQRIPFFSSLGSYAPATMPDLWWQALNTILQVCVAISTGPNTEFDRQNDTVAEVTNEKHVSELPALSAVDCLLTQSYLHLPWTGAHTQSGSVGDGVCCRDR